MTSVEYEVTEQDVRAFSRHIAESAPLFVQARRSTGAFGFIVGTLIGAILAGAQDRTVPALHVVLTMLAVGVPFGYLAWRGYPARYERAVIAADPPHLSRTGYGPHRLSVESDGVSIQGPHISIQIEWSGFTRFEETALYFFLYVSPVRAFIIPKRGLETELIRSLSEVFRGQGA